MPFSLSELGDLLRGGPRPRHEPASTPVGGHGDRDGCAATRLFRHEEATSDCLVVLVWRQNERCSRYQGFRCVSTCNGLRPAPYGTDGRARKLGAIAHHRTPGVFLTPPSPMDGLSFYLI